MDTVYKAAVFITTDRTRKLHLYMKSKYDRDIFFNEAYKKGLEVKGTGVVSVMTWEEALQKTEESIETFAGYGD